MATMTRFNRAFAVVFAAMALALPIQAVAAQPAHAAQAKQATNNTAEPIAVYVDGERVPFSPAPIQKNGTTLVPMRPAFKALRAEVTWEPATNTIFATKEGTNISLKVGSSQAVVDGRTIKLGLPAQIVNGSTMVPLRFVSEALGGKAEWVKATRTVRIESAEYAQAQADKAVRAAEAARGKLSAAEIVESNDDKVVMITTDFGQGSGVVVGDRWVLTNYHVLTGASEGSVEMIDGTSVKIVGVAAADEDADLAIVQTTRELGVEPVAFSSLSSVKKGDKVVAIGSPLGYRNTVSEGLISNTIYEQNVRYYQINAPIDHGSSGGALFNEYGELVGITTSGIEDSSADLNFAVASVHGEMLINDLQFDPPSEREIAFPPSDLPDSLEGASNDEIRELLEDNFGELHTSQGRADFTEWQVTRDAQGWLVMTAEIDPAYYMLYGDKTSDDLRFWAVNLGAELRRMLPGVRLELTVNYSQTFDAEPRGFEPGVVTSLGDGSWRVEYPVIHLQYLDRMHIRVNT